MKKYKSLILKDNKRLSGHHYVDLEISHQYNEWCSGAIPQLLKNTVTLKMLKDFYKYRAGLDFSKVKLITVKVEEVKR